MVKSNVMKETVTVSFIWNGKKQFFENLTPEQAHILVELHEIAMTSTIRKGTSPIRVLHD
jgi:hypothetical protein